MSLYYLLLVMTRFHNDPRVGKALFDTSFVLVTPVKIVGLLTVLVALLLPRPEDAAPRLRSPQSVLFLFFAILPVLETLAFSLPMPSMSISSLISFAFLMVATRLLVTTDDRMRKTVRVMILASTLASLWIYKEYFLQHFDRPGGLEQDPNYEALTLVTGIPLAIWMARHETSRWWRQIGAGCSGLMGFAVVITESRAGLIALGVMALATLLFTRRKFRTLALFTVVAIIFVGLAPASLSQRFHSIKMSGTPSNGDEESARIHFELLRAGVKMIGSNPLFGVGLDQFKSVAPEYNPNIFGIAGRSFVAHDTYIQVAAEGGLPTLALFMALIGLALVNCSAVRRSADAALADLGLAMQLGLVAYGVAAASVTAEFVITLWLLVFLSQSLREISAATMKPARSDVSKQASVRARSPHGIANSHCPSIQRLPGRPSMSRDVSQSLSKN
jgi:O-antigen ligase